MIRTDRAGSAPAELLGRRLGLPLAPPSGERLLGDPHIHPAGGELCAHGAAFEAPLLVASGWVGEVRLLSDGRRQFVGLRLPGDILGVGQAPQAFSTVAITRTETLDASRFIERLAEGASRPDPLRQAWAALREAEQARMVDHVPRLGRLSALERTAHLMLELHERLAEVGLATLQTFHLPLTQEVLADVLGLSIVHVNRTLKQLRQEGLIGLRSGMVSLPDRERLAAISGYALRMASEPPLTAAAGVRRAPKP